jgi:hypothetical protein
MSAPASVRPPPPAQSSVGIAPIPLTSPISSDSLGEDAALSPRTMSPRTLSPRVAASPGGVRPFARPPPPGMQRSASGVLSRNEGTSGLGACLVSSDPAPAASADAATTAAAAAAVAAAAAAALGAASGAAVDAAAVDPAARDAADSASAAGDAGARPAPYRPLVRPVTQRRPPPVRRPPQPPPVTESDPRDPREGLSPSLPASMSAPLGSLEGSPSPQLDRRQPPLGDSPPGGHVPSATAASGSAVDGEADLVKTKSRGFFFRSRGRARSGTGGPQATPSPSAPQLFSTSLSSLDDSVADRERDKRRGMNSKAPLPTRKTTLKAMVAKLDAAFLASACGRDFRRELKAAEEKTRMQFMGQLSEALLHRDLLIADQFYDAVFFHTSYMRKAGCNLHVDFTWILIHHDLYLPLLWRLLNREVLACRDEAVLFRGESPAMALMTDLLRLVGRPLVLELLFPVVHHIVNEIPEEVTFDLEEHRVSSLSLLEQNRLAMIAIVEKILEVLFSSIDAWIKPIRLVVRMLQVVLGQHYPHKVQLIVLNFLFLRFICAAMMSPERWELDALLELNDRTRRALASASKILLQLGTGNPFGVKEPHMGYFNVLLSERSPAVVDYVAEISRPVEAEFAGLVASGFADVHFRAKIDEDAEEITMLRICASLRYLEHLLERRASVMMETFRAENILTEENGQVWVFFWSSLQSILKLLFTKPHVDIADDVV